METLQSAERNSHVFRFSCRQKTVGKISNLNELVQRQLTRKEGGSMRMNTPEQTVNQGRWGIKGVKITHVRCSWRFSISHPAAGTSHQYPGP